MAKFEETLKNSTLTYNTLPENISKKVEDLDKMYKTYKEAIDAKDKETSDKMKKDLIAKDNEIDSLLKKYLDTQAKEKEVKEEPKAEVKEEPEVKEQPKAEVKEETKEETKAETKAETKEDTKEETKEEDSNDDKVTIGFFEC